METLGKVIQQRTTMVLLNLRKVYGKVMVVRANDEKDVILLRPLIRSKKNKARDHLTIAKGFILIFRTCLLCSSRHSTMIPPLAIAGLGIAVAFILITGLNVLARWCIARRRRNHPGDVAIALGAVA